jgi:hypothetical protein
MIHPIRRNRLGAPFERQQIIYSGNRRFSVILEENAVRLRVGSVEIMAGQLDRLLATMTLPRVSLGIIPQAEIRKTFTQVPFWIYDSELVGVETPTAKLEITAARGPALRRHVRSPATERRVWRPRMRSPT